MLPVDEDPVKEHSTQLCQMSGLVMSTAALAQLLTLTSRTTWQALLLSMRILRGDTHYRIQPVCKLWAAIVVLMEACKWEPPKCIKCIATSHAAYARCFIRLYMTW